MEGQKKIYLDKLGYERLREDIRKAEEKLRTIQRFKGEIAIHQGDNWHDNPTLYQAEMQEKMAIHELNNLNSKLDLVEIILPERTGKNVVHLGSNVTVSIRFDDEEEIINFNLITGSPVDSTEVSIYSPLGDAVLGKTINDEFTNSVNKNEITAKVLNVRW